MSAGATILIAGHDSKGTRSLAETLLADGHLPLVRRSIEEALASLGRDLPELALVSIGLPDPSGGFGLIRALRAGEPIPARIDPQTPIIAIGGEGELDCLRAFEQGCDDYLRSPYSLLELRARITALLRRSRTRSGAGRLQVGDLAIDLPGREVRLGGEPIALTATEYALLCHLARDPLRVFTKEELLREVWGFRSLVYTRTLDTHASRLRRKLNAKSSAGFVRSVWGIGYRLIESGARAAA